MSEIVINYKSSAIASMDASGTKTLLTSGKYCEDNIEVVYSRPSAPTPTLQTKSIAFTPAETLQTSSVTYDAGYDGLSAVDISVAAISSSYVGSGVPQKSSADMTRNKSNITAPSGYYSEAAIYNMSNCNALLTQSVDANGLVTAVYSIVTAGYQASGSMTHTTQLSSIGATTYTPSTAAQTISSQYFLTGTQTIEAIPSAYVIPTGTSSITSNGIYDITSFASVDVNVSGGGGGDDMLAKIVDKTISGSLYNSIATEIGSYAFYRCGKLTDINFPNVRDIYASVFFSCSNLATASFPAATQIQDGAFTRCYSLTDVYIPSAESLGVSAFAYCSLSSILLPNLKRIYQYAFRNNSALMSVYITASSVAVLSNVNAFSATPISTSSYTGSFGSIYVPASLVSSYQTATTWKSYSARITSYVE